MRAVSLAVLLSVLLSGCASYREGELARLTGWPPNPPGAKQTISVHVTAEATLNGERRVVPLSILEAWRKATFKAYRDSGLFVEVKELPAKTDFRADVQIIDRVELHRWRAFLTGLTFGLWPNWARDRFVVTTTVRDNKGTVVGKFETSEQVVLWQQLFLVLVMPFNYPSSVENGAVYDLSRAAILEACLKEAF